MGCCGHCPHKVCELRVGSGAGSSPRQGAESPFVPLKQPRWGTAPLGAPTTLLRSPLGGCGARWDRMGWHPPLGPLGENTWPWGVPPHCVPPHCVLSWCVPSHFVPSQYVPSHRVLFLCVPSKFIPSWCVPSWGVPSHYVPSWGVPSHRVPFWCVPS